jgi:hypothetical protein
MVMQTQLRVIEERRQALLDEVVRQSEIASAVNAASRPIWRKFADVTSSFLHAITTLLHPGNGRRKHADSALPLAGMDVKADAPTPQV